MTKKEREQRDKTLSPEDKITFNLIDEATVDRLRRTGDIKLPKKKVSVPKDKAWNTKQMNSRLLRGIENGDSINKIAKSIIDIVNNNEASSVRNARTMVTGAENMGRLDSYSDLEEQGVVQKKVWIATPDDRTRISHLELDGEEVDIDEAFSNGCMCPGDPDCDDPSEVWNCRCSMRDHIVGFRNADGSIRYIEHDRDTTLHDEQIEEEKERREEEPKGLDVDDLGKTTSVYTEDEREEMLRIIDDNDSLSKDIYLKYVDQLDEISTEIDAGHTAYFSPSDGKVHLTPSDVADPNHREDKNAFDTHFHEYGHNIDWIAGGNGKGDYYSVLWRDSEGRSFEDIITGEWDKIFDFSGERAMWQNFELNLDESKGGMGAKSWARFNLRGWASDNDLSYDNPMYKQLKEELRSLESDDDIRNFIKNNIDIFNNGSYNLSNSETKAEIESFCKEIKDKYSLKERTDLSDMFERYSVNHGGPAYPFGIGHGEAYTLRDGSLAKETFAEMFSAEIAQPESLEVIKEYLPESYKAFKEMLGGLK